MKTEITLTIEKSKGYSGHRSGNSYIAKINGLSNLYKLNRTFLAADKIDWRDSELYKKSKGTWEEKYTVTEGLYEICQHGSRWYKIVGVWTPKGQPTDLYASTITEERALKIAGLMDDGWTYDQSRRLSLMPTERIDAIASIVNDEGKTFEEAVAATKTTQKA